MSDSRESIDRLNPAPTSRIYHHLICLRAAVEQAIQDQVPTDKQAFLIDYGCGDMPYRPLFEGIGLKYEGHDLARNDLADRVLSPQGMLLVDSDCADVVLSSQVLEHVEDPAAYLRESHRVLKVGGLLLLSTHGVWQYHPDPNDYWRWTSAGLKKIVQEAGFEIVKFEGIMGPAATAIQIWQDATLARIPRPFQKAFCFVLQGMMRLADSKCSDDRRNADASVYLCVATKVPAARSG